MGKEDEQPFQGSIFMSSNETVSQKEHGMEKLDTFMTLFLLV